jgi:dipeptidyl aminopeptidase/acylaminoacyl peptidase
LGVEFIRIIPGLLIGFSLLFVSAPVLGEMFATMAPVYIRSTVDPLLETGVPYQQVTFPTADGLQLRGWFFPAAKKDAPAVIYAPGAAHDQRSGLSLVSPFHKAGYHVLLFSYRGHAASDGNRFGFTYGALESCDVDAAVRYLKADRGVETIGVIGHSAGAVSVILSAARNPDIKAVVAASPFQSLDSLWETNRPVVFPRTLQDFYLRFSELRKGFSRHHVRPLDVIEQISPRPVLIIHGDLDKRVTREQAESMYSAADSPKAIWYVEDASHGQVQELLASGLQERLIQFFDESFKDQQAKS